MLAVLFATYVIRGKWAYKDIPEVLLDEVDAILIAEGKEHLIDR